MISNCNIKAHRHTQMRGFAYFTSFGIDNVAILLIPGEIDKLTTSSMPKDVTVLKVPRTRTLVHNLIANVVEHAHPQGR